MTDNLDEFDYLDDEQPDDDDVVRKLRQAQRTAKKIARDLLPEVESGKEAKRELVKLQAGLPDTPLVKMFLDSYSGDFTKDAIKAKALEVGLIQPDPEDTERDNQLQAVEAMMQANSGGTPPTAPGSDDAIKAAISQVKAGPQAALEIQKILEAAGRYQSDD